MLFVNICQDVIGKKSETPVNVNAHSAVFISLTQHAQNQHRHLWTKTSPCTILKDGSPPRRVLGRNTRGLHILPFQMCIFPTQARQLHLVVGRGQRDKPHRHAQDFLDTFGLASKSHLARKSQAKEKAQKPISSGATTDGTDGTVGLAQALNVESNEDREEGCLSRSSHHSSHPAMANTEQYPLRSKDHEDIAHDDGHQMFTKTFEYMYMEFKSPGLHSCHQIVCCTHFGTSACEIQVQLAHWPIDSAYRRFGYNRCTEYSTDYHLVGILTCQLKQTSPGALGASALCTAAGDILFGENMCARQQTTKPTTTGIWPGTDPRGQPRRPQKAKCDQMTDLTRVSTRAGKRPATAGQHMP